MAIKGQCVGDWHWQFLAKWRKYILTKFIVLHIFTIINNEVNGDSRRGNDCLR